jgi:hypothetical protein
MSDLISLNWVEKATIYGFVGVTACAGAFV